MSKFLIRMMAILLFSLWIGSSVSWAKPYGPWTMTLYYKYCTGTRWEKWGCKGYLFYRLDYNKNRSGAKSTCDWACNKVLHNTTDRNACYRGCANAYGQEK